MMLQVLELTVNDSIETAEKLYRENSTWPQKLDHELRCIMEQLTKLVEGQFHGRETTPAHESLQVPYRAGSARRRQDC